MAGHTFLQNVPSTTGLKRGGTDFLRLHTTSGTVQFNRVTSVEAAGCQRKLCLIVVRATERPFERRSEAP